MPSRLKSSLWTLSLLLTLAMGVLLGAFLPRDDFFALRKNFQIFGAAYEELVTGYVEPLDPERLMRVGLEAMLSDLDPFTTFIDEADNTDLRIMTRGRYGGVGLRVERRGGKITVIAPVEGASGYKQGMRAGDVLLRVGDQATQGLSLNDVRTLLRGEPGTTVDVTVAREGTPEPVVFTLTREQIELQNVTHHSFVKTGSIGYVKLERFTRRAGPEVREAIEALQKEKALKGLVLDLRDNPGGLLDAAVDVAELFVPKGSVIVSTRGRSDETERVYRSDRDPLLHNVPLVVLVNDYSASASEIVAGALQDLDRGVVMGTTTYGKGLVQVVRSLPHNTSLKMTTAKYYTPSGRSIQSVNYANGDSSAVPDSLLRTYETASGREVRDQHGIEPDVKAPLPAPSPLEAALQRRAAFFFYANHYAAGRDTLAQNFAVTDAVVEDFQTWLRDEGIDYQTGAERSVAAFEERFMTDALASVRDEVDALHAALDAEKTEDFTEHRLAIKHHLEAEILARFATESQQVAAALRHDPQVDQAVGLLTDDSRYAAILTPSASR
jgi:carboxyl-terminal processing protease